jgi:hypothetical protein
MQGAICQFSRFLFFDQAIDDLDFNRSLSLRQVGSKCLQGQVGSAAIYRTRIARPAREDSREWKTLEMMDKPRSVYQC